MLKYAEQFEHDYDNDNYSNYVKDVSVHTGDSYQSEGAMARIYWNEPGSFVDPRGRFGRDLVNSSCASIFCRPNTKNFNLHAAEHLFALLRPRVVGKTSLLSNLGSPLKMKTQIPNINMVRSAWRRVKKDMMEAIIRDLRPAKDVKGGRRIAGESKKW